VDAFRVVHIIARLLWFVFLTLLTQVGGVLWLINRYVFDAVARALRGRMAEGTAYLSLRWLSFGLLYLLIGSTVVPHISRQFGREPLPCGDQGTIVALTPITCILNRNYVLPELRVALEEISADLNELHPGSKIAYMDGSFPFWDGFPMLPHLSHDRGGSIDLAFLYLDRETEKEVQARAPIFFGYGASELPAPEEENRPQECSLQGYGQYNWLHQTFGFLASESLVLDTARTRNMLQLSADHRAIKKIFLEPHLLQRMNLNDGKFRYHGCHSVRHDDHVHLQL